MASRRKECRCETTEDGYVMFDTIFSKRGFCKRKGAKWDPAQRSWRFPLSAASSVGELVAAYYKADYDADSKAGRHQKKRRDDEARKQHKEEHAAELERVLAKWSAELTGTDTIERGQCSCACQRRTHQRWHTTSRCRRSRWSIGIAGCRRSRRMWLRRRTFPVRRPR